MLTKLEKETRKKIRETTKKWEAKENKELLSKLIERYGKEKYIQIVGWNGEARYFKVTTKRIITKGIKAQELLANKYGKEISKEQFKTKA